MTEDLTTIEKLKELLAAIGAYPDPRRASAEWKQAYRLLGKTELETRHFQGVVGMRDVDALAELIGKLDSPATPAEASGDQPDSETCKRALRAFRKRAKFTRLDDESKLGRGPLSKGSDDNLSAISPPAEWPDSVWQALVRQGKLRYISDGMYRMAKE